MKKDKKFWLLCALLVAVIGLVILSLSALYTAAKAINTSKSGASLEKDSKTDETKRNSSYIVREHCGMIGIFSERGELLEMIDTPIIALPQSDRERLHTGITVKDEKELSSLREDYS